MSLTLNMVGGAGGAGLKDTDAVLVVTVPTGSTVTATKGGVTLAPTMWMQAADNTLDCAIFSIKSSLFDAVNPWTVTATLGTDTASDTVVIDDNKEYDLTLLYSLYLIKDGVIQDGFSYTLARGSFTAESGYMKLLCAAGSSNDACVIFSAIDFSTIPYRTLKVDAKCVYAWEGNNAANYPRIGVGDNNPSGDSSHWTAQTLYPIVNHVFDRQIIAADLSSVSGTAYVKSFWRITSNSRVEANHYNIWLE